VAQLQVGDNQGVGHHDAGLHFGPLLLFNARVHSQKDVWSIIPHGPSWQ